jgi:hypothetical protein
MKMNMYQSRDQRREHLRREHLRRNITMSNAFDVNFNIIYYFVD